MDVPRKLMGDATAAAAPGLPPSPNLGDRRDPLREYEDPACLPYLLPQNAAIEAGLKPGPKCAVLMRPGTNSARGSRAAEREKGRQV